jgi:glutathione S-transferase
VNLGAKQQLTPAVLANCPNNKMPAIVDEDPGDLTLFEGGAILNSLPEEHGRLLSQAVQRSPCLQAASVWPTCYDRFSAEPCIRQALS